MILQRIGAFGLVAVSALAALLFLAPAPQAAAQAIDCSSRSLLGVPTWYKYLEVIPVQPTKIVGDPNVPNPNRVPDETKKPICQVVGPCVDKDSGQPVGNCDGTTTRLNVAIVTQRVAIAILDILLRIAGIVAFIFIVVAGFKFVLSEGDANKAKDARNTALNAAIGLGIAIVATGIVSFVGRSISS